MMVLSPFPFLDLCVGERSMVSSMSESRPPKTTMCFFLMVWRIFFVSGDRLLLVHFLEPGSDREVEQVRLRIRSRARNGRRFFKRAQFM